MSGKSSKPARVRGIAILLLVCGASLVATERAGAFADPPGIVNCNTTARTVTAFPNRAVTSWYGGGETVNFSPDLYRWNGARWALYDNTAPWLRGFATNAGVALWNYGVGAYYWVDSRNGITLEHWTFSVEPGYYSVADYYNWPAAGRTLEVEPTIYNGVSASWCYVP